MFAHRVEGRVIRLLDDLLEKTVGRHPEQRELADPLGIDVPLPDECFAVEPRKCAAVDLRQLAIRLDRVVVVGVEHEESRVANECLGGQHGIGGPARFLLDREGNPQPLERQLT